ncbi:MAG: response regulator [Bacteroidetes bacterium]|jgi:CheY-like chemotaxis protein|nr:response regulator [Bacteroidota bacterium]
MIISQGDERHDQEKRMLDHALKVLLVDDNKVNQFLGKRILNNLGVTQVDLAGNGNIALEKINNKEYDVVLTDVEMPGMTGYELCHSIRALGAGKNRLTVIALTANASDEDREKAEAAGIDDYLTKPYSPQDLLDILNKNINVKKRIIVDEFSSDDVIGIEKLHAIFNHNAGDVLQFLKMLSQQLPDMIETIRSGIAEGNREKSFHAAHKLKSPVKLMMESGFAADFSTFTEKLREEASFEEASANFPILENHLVSLLVLINTELERLCK